MVENRTYDIDLLEVAEMFLRKQGITEGHWEIGVAFHATPGSVALGDWPTMPTLFAQVKNLRLARVASPTPLSVDASTLAVFPEELGVIG